MLATDVGGTRELMSDVRMLARSREPAVLASGIGELLATPFDPAALRARSVAHLSWEASLSAMERALDAARRASRANAMKVLYHHRTHAEGGQAVHIRALIEAFRAEGHGVRESALVERAGSLARTARRRPELEMGMGETPAAVRTRARGVRLRLPGPRRLLADARTSLDLLYERHAFGNRGGRIAARRSGLPWVLEVNSPMVHELVARAVIAFPRLARRVEHEILCAADVVALW